MGKIVKIVAGVAIAAGAFALAAPTGGLSIAGALSAFHLSAAVASAIGAIGAAVFATVATLALNALVPTPATTIGRQPTRSQQRLEHTGKPTWPPGPTQLEMSPIDRPWWRGNEFWAWARFGITRVSGDCMKPQTNGKVWWIMDRHATIRANDLFLFGIDDMPDYVGYGKSRIRARLEAAKLSGLGKRFIGVYPECRGLVFEYTFPPGRCETGLDRVKWAYRVRAIERSYFAALRTWWAMRSNPQAYGARLAADHG